MTNLSESNLVVLNHNDVDDMENLKVKANTQSERNEIQELFIALGATCGVEEITSKWVCLYNGQITFYDLLPNVYFKQITIQHLRDLVMLKRNSIYDASFKDAFGDIWYVDSTNNYWMFENGIWRKAEEPLFKLEPIKKLVDKEVKMKEYLDTNYELRSVKQTSGDNHVPAGWIEVPEGAEIFLLDKSFCEDALYFVKHDGEVFHEYYTNATDVSNNAWIKGTIKELHKDMGKVLWQRNPETPNTSIQEKLKFIEKWLNGEKIQYILGVESEKTQWHNFTEGAMQYIKRPDIKFREAPKYVTINGIEFKSVKSLLKHVKNNFDLEDEE